MHELSKLCTCPIPRPTQVATHKGAALTVCARCGRPLPLGLGEPPRRAA